MPRVPAAPLPRLAAFALDAVTYLIIPALLLPLGCCSFGAASC